jgi:integrase
MSEHHSTAGTGPAKPDPKSPLFRHRAGYWAKKIRGKIHYFGPRWHDDAEAAAVQGAALNEYDAQKEALHAGRKPREATDALAVKELANQFLDEKEAMVEGGELSKRTWQDYKDATDLIVSSFGKARLVADLGPDDFAALRKKMAKRFGPHRLAKTIQCVRSVFKYGFESDLIDRPVRYGPGFDRPSKKTMRLHRAAQGAKLFTADELRKMIEAAPVQLKAMLLLGINCGFGNSDVGNLPLSALDLGGGWVNYARPKTGVDRRCPLWAETVDALRAALARRPEPKSAEDAQLVFVTKYGQGWAKDTSDAPITKEVRKLLNALGINGHRNFYTIRHTFRTVADEARDQPAADYIMGHESPHMSNHYRETISDARLKAVTDYVRSWLFPPKAKVTTKKKATAPVEVADAAPTGE